MKVELQPLRRRRRYAIGVFQVDNYTLFAYPLAVELIRTSSYASGVKRLKKLGATDADMLAMEDAFAAAPEASAVIPKSGGMRKVRFGYGDKGDRWWEYHLIMCCSTTTRPTS